MAIIKTVEGKTPKWGKNCFIAENAALTGDCILGDDCSIWYSAVLRSDVDAIIAAGAVVTHGTKVPAHEIWAGIPAKKVKDCAPGQAEEFAKHYAGYIKDWYLEK